MLDKHASCVLGSKTDMASVTLEEKRLKQLKQQLFGKEQPLASQAPKSKLQITTNLQTTKDSQISKYPASQTALLDPISIKRDLIKIVTFSFIALCFQLSLFFAAKQGLINLFN